MKCDCGKELKESGLGVSFCEDYSVCEYSNNCEHFTNEKLSCTHQKLRNACSTYHYKKGGY